MTFNASGNLGLGVTPSAWNSAWRALEIGRAGNALTNNAVNGAGITSNAVLDSVGWKFGGTGYANFMAVGNGGGSFAWYTSTASGTAGNTITFTQAMTLDASGNLGVGTTSQNERIRINSSTAGEARMTIAYNGTVITYFGSYSGIVGSGNADDTFLTSVGAKNLIFGTNSTERARITSGGYSKFSNDGTYTNSAGSYHEFRQSSQTEEGMILRTTNASYSGNSLLVAADRNTTNNSFYAFGYYNFAASAYKLRIADSGDVTNTNGTYGTISDVKMKTDIVDAGSQWADIKGLRFRKFKMKDDPTGLTQLGVVAQEVEQISPGLVDEHADRDAEGNDLGTTTKSVKTSVLLMKAAVALQEAMSRIEKLEAEVTALKGA